MDYVFNVFTFSQEGLTMFADKSQLVPRTYKLAWTTLEGIEQIKHDRMTSEKTLFGFCQPINNTDVLRFLVNQELSAIAQRAAAAAAEADRKARLQVKADQAKQRRARKGGGK
jgi:hypothetical protein